MPYLNLKFEQAFTHFLNIHFKKKLVQLSYTIYLLPLYFLSLSCSFPQDKELLTGADVLLRDHLDLLKGKSSGIVTNHTAILNNGTHLVDTLNNLDQIKITALFGPEHGIRGISAAGEEIESRTDIPTGIPVYSLYGKDKKPTKEMLKNVDLLIYDIQDVGVRFYTYISTMFYVLQAAAENNISLIILDRPNPIDGVTIEGPVISEDLKSFVGIAPIPVRYGMTSGELANYFSGEGLLGNNLKADLTIIKMESWTREKYYNDYDFPWVPPSPNIPDFQSALVYPGTCLLEGTNISEGRGTKHPFTTIGAPFIKSEELINELKKNNLSGVELSPVSFTPVVIAGTAEHPKYKNELCHGIFIKVTKKEKFKGFEFGIKLLSALVKLYPDTFKFNPYFDKLSGDKTLKDSILENKTFEEIIFRWQKETETFKAIRNKYLLY
ncbi:MAG: DUF1343 domain-containing protein [Ignavibacteriales bacterium]|nr:MAG: DUF1343 domain-containing protein [Ignavibacteriales bacterium]